MPVAVIIYNIFTLLSFKVLFFKIPTVFHKIVSLCISESSFLKTNWNLGTGTVKNIQERLKLSTAAKNLKNGDEPVFRKLRRSSENGEEP